MRERRCPSELFSNAVDAAVAAAKKNEPVIRTNMGCLLTVQDQELN